MTLGLVAAAAAALLGGPSGTRQRASKPRARCLAEEDPAKLNQLAVSCLWKKLNFKHKGF